MDVEGQATAECTHWLRYGLIHPTLDILATQGANKRLAIKNTRLQRPTSQTKKTQPLQALQNAFLRLRDCPQQNLPKSDTPADLAALILQILDKCQPARQLVKDLGQPHAEEVLQTRLRRLLDLRNNALSQTERLKKWLYVEKQVTAECIYWLHYELIHAVLDFLLEDKAKCGINLSLSKACAFPYSSFK